MRKFRAARAIVETEARAAAERRVAAAVRGPLTTEGWVGAAVADAFARPFVFDPYRCGVLGPWLFGPTDWDWPASRKK